MDFPLPVSHTTLLEIQNDLVLDARDNDEHPGIVDAYLTEFVHRLQSSMEDSGTVFYQP